MLLNVKKDSLVAKFSKSRKSFLVEFSPIMKVSFQRTKKRGLLHTLLDRSFSTCCDFKTFQFEIDHLKTILIKNNYPLNFIDSCIKSFFSKLYTTKVVVPNVPKRNVFVKFRSWEVLRFIFERSFKNYLVINWRLVI